MSYYPDTTPLPTRSVPIPESRECQDHHHKKITAREVYDKFVKVLELTIEVALLIFAAYTSPILLGLGLAGGAIYQIAMIATGIDVPEGDSCSTNCGPSDARRYMRRNPLPHEVVILAGLYFFSHMRHEPEFFVPIFGAFIGARVVWWGYNWYKDRQKAPEAYQRPTSQVPVFS